MLVAWIFVMPDDTTEKTADMDSLMLDVRGRATLGRR